MGKDKEPPSPRMFLAKKWYAVPLSWHASSLGPEVVGLVAGLHFDLCKVNYLSRI